MSKSFTHLRVASGYSFQYGTAHARDLVDRAGELGMAALALTDRDGMAGVIRFVQACESAGIKPIVGVNLSFLQKKFRITLLAQAGHLDSLYRLLSAVHLNNEENLLTHDLLEKFAQYSKNLLVLHGPESPLAAAITARRSSAALSIHNSTRDLFADQALECVSHQIRGTGAFSTSHAGKLLAFARDHDLPAVITNAVRMLDSADGPVADVLDAARNLRPLSDDLVERKNSEAYLKSPQQMHDLADEIARMAGERNGRTLIKTTLEWADRAILSPRRDVGIGEIHLPEPSVLGAAHQSELITQLRARCESGLHHRYFGAASVPAAGRLEDELATVRTLGFESYFLIVADIVAMARTRKIRVAARGSGAGSLICYLLGISGVEPMAHGLLMERFCSTLRGELPDIDIDVESARRLEIYDAIFTRYGDNDWSKPGNQSRCATVAMVETYRARHAIRDVASALKISPMEIDFVAKSLPHVSARNISTALKHLPELQNLKLDTPLWKSAIALAQRLDGLPRHLAMHPCAIALSDIRLQDFAPIQHNASGYPMVAFDKDDVEAIGLLKLDVLGVRMQSSISYALSEIERVEGEVIDIDAIRLDDHETFDLIKSTRTLGLFQIESPGQRELVGKLAPNTFTDLIIDISLFRPGPVKSDMINPFLRFRHGLAMRTHIHPDLENILHETEGVIVFHEQVIKVIATLTGCTLAEADEKRRQLGDKEGQQRTCDWFYPAALSRGYSYEVTTQIWEILRAFASFGFCKAHAAAFALPTYQSAWLKTHHTAAFIAGALTHDPGMYPKRLILDEARQWGIIIAPIDINRSDRTYRVERTDLMGRTPYQAPDLKSTGDPLCLPDARGYAIRIAFSDIKGISEGEIDTIISGQPYLDLADFSYRSGASKPITENLVTVGAFDQLHGINTSGVNRRDLLLHLSDLHRLSGSKNLTTQNQLTFNLQPSDLIANGFSDFTANEEVAQEMAILGMDTSQHLIHSYGTFLNEIKAVRSNDLIRQRAGTSVLVAGIKVALQTPPVRSGRRVIFLTLDDGYGCNDITFFEDAQQSYAELLYRSKLFLIEGEIRRTGPRGISLRATKAWDLTVAYQKWNTNSLTSITSG